MFHKFLCDQDGLSIDVTLEDLQIIHLMICPKYILSLHVHVSTYQNFFPFQQKKNRNTLSLVSSLLSPSSTVISSPAYSARNFPGGISSFAIIPRPKSKV